jgi:chlorophyll synthase
VGLQHATSTIKTKRLVGKLSVRIKLRRLGVDYRRCIACWWYGTKHASLTFAILYSLSAHGIMTLNDFKAIEGDRRMGVRSLPVQLGVDRAARLACWVMIVPQVIVLILLLYWDRSNYALAIAGLIVCQLVLMRKFLSDPVRYALFYSGFGVPLLVSGMMVSAFAIHAFGAR